MPEARSWMGAALLVALLTGLVSSGAAASPQNAPADPPGDAKKVGDAIRKGIEFLRKSPTPVPIYEAFQVQNCDELLLLTFLAAGVPENDPDFHKYLKNVLNAPFQSVYQVALQAMVLEELDRVKYQGRIWQCAQFLVDAQFPDGLWSYGERTLMPDPPVPLPPLPAKPGATTRRPADAATTAKRKKPAVTRKIVVKKLRDGIGAREHLNNSSAMYAALGLRACQDSGIVIPREVIDRGVKWWVDHQFSEKQEKGGATATRGGPGDDRVSWTYFLASNPAVGKTPTLAMTTGAVGSLVIYDYLLGADWKKNKLVNGGINWIADHFSVSENTGSDVVWGHKRAFLYYYLYALERLGVLCDTPSIGSHSWYSEGATLLLQEQKPDGSWNNADTWVGRAGDTQPVYDTCFAILFLKRATSPLRDVASEDRFIKKGE